MVGAVAIVRIHRAIGFSGILALPPRPRMVPGVAKKSLGGVGGFFARNPILGETGVE